MSQNVTSFDQSAACACDAVQVHIKGRPISMFLCACRDCQKASGSGHSALILVKTADFEIAGETRGFSVIAASGNKTTRHFCPACGTPVFGETEANPQLRLVPAGLFEDTSWYQPRSTIFHRTHNDWDTLPEIPSYETYKETTDA